MDRLHSMRVFAKVVELGSFAAAARALDLSPALVTRQVADLERHLGARLLNRTTRSLALTDTGQDYLKRAQDVLERVDEAENVARDAGTEAAGILRVTTGASFAAQALVAELPDFARRYPRVHLDLQASGTVINTPDEEMDVSILIAQSLPENADFVARRLASSEIVSCASPQYLARQPEGAPRRPEDLLHHANVVPEFPGVPRRWPFAPRDGGATVEMQLSGSMTVHHIDVLRAAAEAGLGIASLPSFVAAPAVAAGRLEWVLSAWRQPSVGIWAVLPSRRYLPARTRVFVDWLVQTFGGEEADPWLKGCPSAT